MLSATLATGSRTTRAKSMYSVEQCRHEEAAKDQAQPSRRRHPGRRLRLQMDPQLAPGMDVDRTREHETLSLQRQRSPDRRRNRHRRVLLPDEPFGETGLHRVIL